MEIIDLVINKISGHYSSSSYVMANALASACNTNYGVSLLDASVRLDGENKQLFNRLANIREEPDYCNDAQANALTWLLKNKYIK